eukprot:5881973-Amphidinium_carterae.1
MPVFIILTCAKWRREQEHPCLNKKKRSFVKHQISGQNPHSDLSYTMSSSGVGALLPCMHSVAALQFDFTLSQ